MEYSELKFMALPNENKMVVYELESYDQETNTAKVVTYLNKKALENGLPYKTLVVENWA